MELRIRYIVSGLFLSCLLWLTPSFSEEFPENDRLTLQVGKPALKDREVYESYRSHFFTCQQNGKLFFNAVSNASRVRACFIGAPTEGKFIIVELGRGTLNFSMLASRIGQELCAQGKESKDYEDHVVTCIRQLPKDDVEDSESHFNNRRGRSAGHNDLLVHDTLQKEVPSREEGVEIKVESFRSFTSKELFNMSCTKLENGKVLQLDHDPKLKGCYVKIDGGATFAVSENVDGQSTLYNSCIANLRINRLLLENNLDKESIQDMTCLSNR